MRQPSGREEPESGIDIRRFKNVKEVYFVEGIIEAYLPLRDEGSGLLRLEAVRSPGERDYLVAVYRQMEVPVSAPDGTKDQPATQRRTVSVWATYDLIRGTAPTAEGALRQVLGFLEMRCA